ncbi:MAG: PorT family protein [Prevotella sp.]|nr:PorT family protein [Prevotella sp.]MDY4038713.1 outer membrane beta-barrel protein [Prevotella sp.]
MRKVLSTLLLAVGLMAMTPAAAQLKFGLKGGLNVTTMSLKSEVFDASNRAGFFIGPTIKFSLPLVGLGVDMAALYDQREFEVKTTAETAAMTTVLKQKQMVVPVNLRYNIGLGSAAGVFLFAGPQFGFNLGDKDIKDEVAEWTLRSSNFSMNIGGGFTILSHLQLSAGYNIVFGKTGDVNVGSAIQDSYDQVRGKGEKGRMNSWQIALAYYF